jgi:hypothetical protein
MPLELRLSPGGQLHQLLLLWVEIRQVVSTPLQCPTTQFSNLRISLHALRISKPKETTNSTSGGGCLRLLYDRLFRNRLGSTRHLALDSVNEGIASRLLLLRLHLETYCFNQWIRH